MLQGARASTLKLGLNRCDHGLDRPRPPPLSTTVHPPCPEPSALLRLVGRRGKGNFNEALTLHEDNPAIAEETEET